MIEWEVDLESIAGVDVSEAVLDALDDRLAQYATQLLGATLAGHLESRRISLLVNVLAPSREDAERYVRSAFEACAHVAVDHISAIPVEPYRT